MIDVNLRTTLLAIATIGLFATAFAAPATATDASDAQDIQATSGDPGQCMQVYLFVLEIGPVTIDASDSCWEIIIDNSEECNAEDLEQITRSASECREALETFAEDTCSDAAPAFDCAIETDPCFYVSTPCNIHCTCDPIIQDPLAE